MRIVVTGVPGVGKSTCMEAASKTKNLKIVNFGDAMFEAAKEMGIEDRDDLRKMPLPQQKDVQKRAAEKLAAMTDIIIDTHCMVQTPWGFLPGLPLWVLERIRPAQIFLIEADPKNIVKRREKDPTRTRDPDTEENVARHQEFNRIAAIAYSTLSGASIVVIVNAEGKVEEAVERMLSTL